VLEATEADLAAARALAGERRRIGESDRAAANAPASTKDGVGVRVLANLGSPSEAAGAVAHGAEGCGLLRTEFLFLDRLEAPGEAEQSRVYEEVAAALQPRPLTIRTLDFGSDKPLAYLPLPREDNPALGIRGLRASLRDVRVLRGQLRAIVAKRLATPVRIMLPMVTELSELRTARALLEEECRAAGVAVPALGVMIETPSSALLADQLVREADFLSLGTNDLAQYTLAIDRGHAELSDRLDALHPATLRLIAMAARAASEARKPIGVCGALGADPDAIPILVGLGITDLSVVPAAVPRVKRTIRTLDAAACRGLAQAALGEPDAPAVRALVQRMRLP
jgi:multiphosphoryl transfer protein